MRLNEIRNFDGPPIDGYGPGFFRVGGTVWQGGVFVTPSGVQGWTGFDDTAPLGEAAGGIDVLFIGTGADPEYLPAAFRTALEEAGLGLEPMASPPAARTYNVLLSEGRRVGVALLPV